MSVRPTRFPLPTRTVAFCIALASVITGLNLAKGLVDPDGFFHLATARWIVANGSIPQVDPFTFTWRGQPWIPHEWLGALLMHTLRERFGEVGLVVAWSLFPAGILTILIAALRGAGLRLAAIAPPAILCCLVLTPYVTLRPQAISWLFLAILLWALIAVRPRRARWLLVLGPAFGLWANLHGLYVLGLGVLLVYLGFTLVGRTALAKQRGWVAGGLVAALAGTLVTPAGLAGLVYPLRYLEAGDWGLGYIPEWNTPNFHEPAHLLLIALIVAVGLSAFRGAPGWLAIMAAASVPAALLAMRSAPIAAVLAMPVLAFALETGLSQMAMGSAAPTPDPIGRRVIDVAAAVAVAVAAWIVLVPGDLQARIDDEVHRRFPVESIGILTRVAPEARVFAEYSWGGYVGYRLHERGGSNYIDGRNDMFDQAILDDYSTIRAADSGWEARLDGYGATAIVLPPEAPLVRGPAQEAGWCEAYRSSLEVLLLRACVEAG